MNPIIGEQDDFEGRYVEAFRSLARPYGEFVHYERDRAAIDVGLHLTEQTKEGFRTVANTRVWFQLKGLRATTLTRSQFEESTHVALDLDVADLKFWYASPETVYLAVYVEAAGLFLAEDIRDVVDRRWGDGIFSPATFKPGQKSARVRVQASSVLNDAAWTLMASHRSMRIDGPSFRGRPLGHRLDPLRSQLAPLEPEEFARLVARLLEVHEYEPQAVVDPEPLFPEAVSLGDVVEITEGILNYTYEWVLQMTTAFGVGDDDRFRIEGSPNHAQGGCAVVVHSKKESMPDPDAIRTYAESLAQRGAEHLLVFVNDASLGSYYGAFSTSVRGTGVSCAPQHLGDLTFSVLVATNVYLEFRDRISWRLVNYLS